MRVLACRRLTLRWRFLFLLGLVATVLIVDGVREILAQRETLITVARERLAESARSGAVRQSDFIGQVWSLLTLAVEMPEADVNAGNACRVPYLRTADAIPWLAALGIVSPDGTIVCTTGDNSRGVMIGDRPYFQEALRTRSFALSEILLTRSDKRPGLLAAMPRIVAGDIRSVVIARLDLDWLNTLVSRIGEVSNVSVALADASGTVVSIHPHNDKAIGQKLSAIGWPDQRARDLRVFEHTGPDGLIRIFAAAPLAHGSGQIVVGADKAVVLAPAQTATLYGSIKLALVLVIGAGALCFGVERLVVRPLEALAAVSTKLGEGDLSARTDEVDVSPELAELGRTFNHMAARLALRDAELRAVNQHLAELATVDPLTGLANRRLFDERLANEWRRAERSEKPLSAIIFDVDCFKAYNDRYGHAAGDDCLRKVAAVIAGEKREGDLAARIGGEEFALILPGADPYRAMHVARLVRLKLQSLALPHAGSPLGIVTISAGVSSRLGTERLSAENLMAAADEALYRSKRSGRNRVTGPDPVAMAS